MEIDINILIRSFNDKLYDFDVSPIPTRTSFFLVLVFQYFFRVHWIGEIQCDVLVHIFATT